MNIKLLTAVKEGQLDLVKKFLPSAPTSRERKTIEEALVATAERGNSAIVKELLTKKPDLEAFYDGRTALLATAQHGHVETMDILVKAGN